MQEKVLIGATLTELKQLSQEMGMPAFTGKQLAEWLYVKRVTDFADMTNISKQNREKLSNQCQVGVTPPQHQVVSEDGTEKYLFRLSDGYTVETGGMQNELSFLYDRKARFPTQFNSR